MSGAWVIGAVIGLTLLLWDQARLRRYARRAAIAPPDRVPAMARRRLAESVAAGTLLAVIAFAAVVLSGPGAAATAEPGGLVGYATVLAGFCVAWAAGAWALVRFHTPGSGRGERRRRA